MTKSIDVYADYLSVTPTGDSANVFLSGVDIGQIYSEFSLEEWFGAIIANDDFSKLADLVTKELESENE